MTEPPKNRFARKVWETCPECFGELRDAPGGDLVCPKGHYRASGAASEATHLKPVVADGSGGSE